MKADPNGSPVSRASGRGRAAPGEPMPDRARDTSGGASHNVPTGPQVERAARLRGKVQRVSSRIAAVCGMMDTLDGRGIEAGGTPGAAGSLTTSSSLGFAQVNRIDTAGPTVVPARAGGRARRPAPNREPLARRSD
jgi:hypothetical protein